MASFTRILKDNLNIVRRRRPRLWKDRSVSDTAFLGTDYGGWTVWTPPIGGESVVLSFGIGLDNSFDLEVIDRFGVTVHAFDPTPGLAGMLESENKVRAGFEFYPYGLAHFDGDIEMRPLDPSGHSSSTILDRSVIAAESAGDVVRVKRIATIASELGIQHIDLLKMDIEGAEFDAIPDMIASGVTIDQWLIEFHTSFPDGMTKTEQLVSQLRAAGYHLIDISSRGMEFAFLHQRLLARP